MTKFQNPTFREIQHKLQSKFGAYTLFMLLISATSAFIFFFTDADRVDQNYVEVFKTSRGFTFLSCLFIAYKYLTTKNPKPYIIFFCILMHLYALVGIWFLPLYEMSFLQIVVGFIFMKYMTNQINYLISTVSFFCIFLSYLIMHEIGWTRPAASREDYIFILLFFSIIIYCVYYYVVLNEKLQQEKNARFRFIGEQSQAILSEIDRMMIIPLQISQKMKNNESNKISSNPSELLYSEFVQIKSLFKNINRLIIPENDSEIVSIKSCIEEAQKLLKFKKSHVTMNLINCEKSIEASHNRMVSVFFNLIMNSTDEFEKRNTHNPQINIECFDHSIVYTDNAVSNALDLNDFNQNTALTTYKSGIGIEMIRHDIEMMKLQITSYETNNNFSYMITGFR